ncbi:MULTISPECIES: GNAT family N-acetyltransferase [Flavobacterium]|uniref:GNAT family N-acetyltransferase n=1 Tax=Flavobacterium hankyongi TaxID=1176532 RepID=A0ABP8ZVG9_9FLAO|nr:GNAT family N-acetyltransferase [Flavobacterium sp. N1846]
MKQFKIKKYNQTDFNLWNNFVANAKNGTFLFHRNFMQYHSDRFEDCSLFVSDEKEKLVAILPANKVGNELFSHQGLTYGGLVYNDNLKLEVIINIFHDVLKFLYENSFEKITIKCIPLIYHKKPADEMLYVLFLLESKLIRRDSLAVIDLKKENSISKGRMEGVSKGVKNELEIVEESNFEKFWNSILIPNLNEKHNALPVHSLKEIEYLHSKFSKNIRQFNVYKNSEIVAGTTIFESEQVAHAQYISANSTKNELGSLDYLYYHLITNVFKDKKFLDFGISNEDNGKILNKGLSFWKESFGASAITQDFYEVSTSKFINLLNVLK